MVANIVGGGAGRCTFHPGQRGGTSGVAIGQPNQRLSGEKRHDEPVTSAGANGRSATRRPRWSDVCEEARAGRVSDTISIRPTAADFRRAQDLTT